MILWVRAADHRRPSPIASASRGSHVPGETGSKAPEGLIDGVGRAPKPARATQGAGGGYRPWAKSQPAKLPESWRRLLEAMALWPYRLLARWRVAGEVGNRLGVELGVGLLPRTPQAGTMGRI
jgi:hypothetical protein